jgi:ADP-ribose pyrophosphatase YjhB (NUDIX family)
MENQKENTGLTKPWLDWATELQFIAQAGLTYSKDSFDIERFERIREISAEMMSLKTGIPIGHVRDVFCNETGFQTPKLDSRAAIFEDNKILLVKENNGTWSLPGGWVDYNESIRSSIIKEVKEESGFDAIPVKIIAIQDRNKHNLPLYAYGICKIFVLCEVKGGEFKSNIETLGRDFFTLNELPLLATEKNTKEQIELCFQAYYSENWDPVFD